MNKSNTDFSALAVMRLYNDVSKLSVTPEKLSGYVKNRSFKILFQLSYHDFPSRSQK